MGNSKRTETRGFIGAILFILCYAGWLFVLRHLLLRLEGEGSSILKPEPGQIVAVALIALMYYCCYLGLHAFSRFGNPQRLLAASLALLIHLGFLYGFKLWFDAIANNPFLSFNPATAWYANEQVKFWLANGPLLLFFLLVFILRLFALLRPENRAFSSSGIR